MRMARMTILGILIILPQAGRSQNCCAPAVPQQAVVGETVALPHALEIGVHFEYLRARRFYIGSLEINDPNHTRADWEKATLSLSYGVSSRFSITALLPYVWKSKSRDLPLEKIRLENSSRGIGDITLILRTSLIARTFVDYRELSLGLGIKLPVGVHDRRNYGFLLPQELQPGTGSWDSHLSLTFYQGFETVDLLVAGGYMLTTSHRGYKFGNQLNYLLSASFHVKRRVDIAAALTGALYSRDKQGESTFVSTGKSQLWFSPSLQIQVIPERFRMHVYSDLPIYQHFNGVQLGSDYNIRFSLFYLIPLKESSQDQ